MIVKKLSVGKVVGKIRPEMYGRKVMRACGIARAVKTGASTIGEWTALVGEFAARAEPDGEWKHSAVIFLPSVVQDGIVAELRATGSPIEFGYDLVPVADNESPVGYHWEAEALVKLAPDSRLAALMSAGDTPALEAPSSVPKKRAKR